MTSDAARPVTYSSLDDVLITAALARRPQRPPDYEAENRALAILSEALAECPQAIFQTLVETAKDVCRADSAGISLLDPAEGSFSWRAIVGPFAVNLGGRMPRHASPCGTVVDRDASLLFAYPERHFSDAVAMDPPTVEALLAPLRTGGQPIGTLWVISHTPSRQFDTEDQRLLTSLARFAGFIADITERTRTEGELRVRLARELEDAKVLQRISSLLIEDLGSEQLYDQILDAAIAIMRADFGSIQMLDRRRNELRLLRWRNLHPESAEYWRTLPAEAGTSCSSVLQHGERIIVPDVDAADVLQDPESRRHCVLSGIVAMQSTPLTTRAGSILGVISTHWRQRHEPSEREFALLDVLVREAADALERRHAEQAMRKQANLVQLSFDAIIVWTLDGTIESWNKGAEVLYGYTRDDAVGRRIHDLLGTVHPIPWPEILATLKDSGHWEGEIRHQTKDGRDVTVSARKQLIVDTDNTVRVLETNRDITDRKQAEDALRHSHTALQVQTEQLRHRTQQLRRLASDLTISEQRTRESLAKLLHDHLQQVLFSAKLRVDRLAAAPADAARALAGKVRDDLDQAIAAARSLSVELAPPQLHQRDLPGALAWLATSIQEKYGLTVDVAADPRATVEAKDLRLLVFESVRELLFDIVKHAQVTRATLDVMLTPDDQLQIVVADEGVGFDPSAVFGPAVKPLGWGLFSIRERAELLGGHFHVESAPGRGTRFTLVIPRGEQTIATEPDPLRILIADDHVVARAGLRELLAERREFQIVGEATSGAEAVSLAQTLHPDAIIMDVSMPDMDGIEATRRIHGAQSAVQILGLSTQAHHEGLHPIEAAGAVGYFSKGDDARLLIEQLLALHANKRAST